MDIQAEGNCVTREGKERKKNLTQNARQYKK